MGRLKGVTPGSERLNKGVTLRNGRRASRDVFVRSTSYLFSSKSRFPGKRLPCSAPKRFFVLLEIITDLVIRLEAFVRHASRAARRFARTSPSLLHAVHSSMQRLSHVASRREGGASVTHSCQPARSKSRHRAAVARETRRTAPDIRLGPAAPFPSAPWDRSRTNKAPRLHTALQ